MAKLYVIEDNGIQVGYAFDCPGCKLGHAVHISPYKNDLGASWSFDGNMNAPTFNPSIISKVEVQGKTMICHIFVRQGKIEFLNDCTHELAGQTVQIPDVD